MRTLKKSDFTTADCAVQTTTKQKKTDVYDYSINLIKKNTTF